MRKTIPAIMAAALALASCEHKELCFDHELHALEYRQEVVAVYEHEWEYAYGNGIDWEAAWPAEFPMAYDDLRPKDPAGLRVFDYAPGGATRMFNLPSGGGEVNLTAGDHSLMLYNNDTEYIVFSDEMSYTSARAFTRSRTRASYGGSPFSKGEEENTVNAPDMLYGCYVESYVAKKSADVQRLPVTMKPLVFTYVIRCEITHGLEYVALARGALAGMARSVYINSGTTGPERATILFDCTVDDGFGATAAVNTFGVPDFPNEHYATRAAEGYGLNVEVRLKNGRVLSFDFDISDQMARQPHGGVITVTGIEIPDEEGKAGNSGFNVNISDWGPYEDVDLSL